MSEVIPVVVVPKRSYKRRITTLNDQAKVLLNERYKGERTTFRHNNQRYIVPFSAQDFQHLSVRYNQEVEQERKNRKNELARERRAEIKRLKIANTESTFIIHMTLRGTYYKTFYDYTTNIRYKEAEVITWNESTNPMTEKNAEQFIPNYVANEIEHDDGYKIIEVVEYTVEYMGSPPRDVRPVVHQPMTRDVALKNDWLKFSHGIAQSAYDDSGGKCVYHQLDLFLNNPPTGRPTRFINKEHTSQQSLFNFFQQWATTQTEYYDDFSMLSGVSIEMIAELCRSIKRNMYAYDADDKLIHTVTSESSKKYCPIVYYKLHGHCFLIDDPTIFWSVAESNKRKGVSIVTTTVTDCEKVEGATVYQIDQFDVAMAGEYAEGIYLVQSDNFGTENLQYINRYGRIPYTKTTKSSITEIKFEVGLINSPKPTKDEKDTRRWVRMCIDATKKESYNYEQLKRIADANNVPYVNGGMGSLILSVLKQNGKHARESLNTEQRKQFFDQYNNKCALCQLVCPKLHIDRIVPLGSGGSNDLVNLQPLCPSCHSKKTVEENELGYGSKEGEASIFNQVTLDNVVNTTEFKTWQFIEKVSTVSCANNLPVHKIDMRKCRRNLTYFSKYEFPVYTVMDIPRQFSGVLRCGLFYVETELTYLFRGNGWYSQPLVEYALAEQLITLEDIKGELIPSTKLQSNHFQKPIQTLLNTFQDDLDLQKLSVNTLIGLFGRTKQSSAHTKFSLCPFEASNWWADNKTTKSEVFIRTIPLNNGRKLYEGIFTTEVQMESTKYPIYKQILEMEAVELHRLESIIQKSGGVVLDRNTDAIRFCRMNPINIDSYFWDDNQQVSKYQYEDPKELSIEILKGMKRDFKFDVLPYQEEWNTRNDYEGTVDDEARRIIALDQSIHIDGRAGTGKSYLVNRIRALLEEIKKGYLGFSPTNKGARIIGGQTIHSIYYKFKNNRKVLFGMLEKVEYIFLDEVSMMELEFYNLFCLIKRAFPSIKFIIAGDFGQLPPVDDKWTGDYENSPALHMLCGGNRIKLTQCRRSDDALFQLCANVEGIIKKDFKPTAKTYLNIAYTHKTRIRVNKECMERYNTEFPSETVFVPKVVLNPKSQDVYLRPGMPVVCHTTNKKLRILNSQTFTVDTVTDESLVLKSGEDTFQVTTKDFHKFYYVGFCLTIHASQGESFADRYTIYDWYQLEPRAKYVAMSRGTNIANIQIA